MFYEKFLKLCLARNVSPSAAAKAAGFSNGAASDWKNGAIPRTSNLLKLANYFDVPLSYFNDNCDSPPLSDRRYVKSQIDLLTNEEFEKLLQLAKIALPEKFDK